jgi:Spy/CpxP family protein refolding chaperone
MKKRNVFIISLLSMVMATGFAACKHGHHAGGFDKFDLEAAVKRIASRLDLDESQKADLEKITAEIAAKAKEMHGDREAHHKELADLVRQQAISRDTVDRLVAGKMEKMQKMADFAADRLIAFHATLTDEQREKIAEHIEEKSENRCRFFRH